MSLVAYLRSGPGVTAPVLADGAATYTPGVSEVRGGVSTFTTGGLKNQDAQWSAAGAPMATRQYDPGTPGRVAFGNVVGSSGTWSGPFGYGGAYGYQEDPSGLKLLGHRYYDSTTGSFLSRDPIKDGRNWYAYCAGDPVGSADSAGLTWATVALITLTARPEVEIAVDLRGVGHAWIEVRWPNQRPLYFENSMFTNISVGYTTSDPTHVTTASLALPFDDSRFRTVNDVTHGLPDEYNMTTNNCVRFAEMAFERMTGQNVHSGAGFPLGLCKSIERWDKPIGRKYTTR